MNSSPLNPDAPVFVPGSVAGSDVLLAESPRKPLPMEDIIVPDVKQFETEADGRPAELQDLDNCDQLNGHHNMSIEGITAHLNGNNKCEMDSFEFNVGIDSDKTKDSTLIEEIERIQKDTTDFCDIQVFQTNTETNPFGLESNDDLFQRLKNKERDPMSMSFYQEKDDDTCERYSKLDSQVDLNSVQPLPDSDDEDLQPNGECQNITEDDKENISPAQHTDLFSQIDNDNEPNNDIMRFDDRNEAANNYAIAENTVDCNVESNNMEDYPNVEFECNLEPETVAPTDTPESHKLLFEQIPEIPDGKSSELGFNNDDNLDPSESEKDFKGTTSHDDLSQNDEIEIKLEESPSEETKLETQDPIESTFIGHISEEDNEIVSESLSNIQTSEQTPNLPDITEVVKEDQLISGLTETNIVVDVHQSEKEIIQFETENQEIEINNKEDILFDSSKITIENNEILDHDTLTALSLEVQSESPLLQSEPQADFQVQETLLPTETSLPKDSDLLEDVLSKSPLPSELISDVIEIAESLVPSGEGTDSPLPTQAPLLNIESESLITEEVPLIPAEVPLPRESPAPSDSPLPEEHNSQLSPLPAEDSIQRASPFSIEECIQRESPVFKEELPLSESPNFKEELAASESPLFKEELAASESPLFKEELAPSESPIFKEELAPRESPLLKEELALPVDEPVIKESPPSVEESIPKEDGFVDEMMTKDSVLVEENVISDSPLPIDETVVQESPLLNEEHVLISEPQNVDDTANKESPPPPNEISHRESPLPLQEQPIGSPVLSEHSNLAMSPLPVEECSFHGTPPQLNESLPRNILKELPENQTLQVNDIHIESHLSNVKRESSLPREIEEDITSSILEKETEMPLKSSEILQESEIQESEFRKILNENPPAPDIVTEHACSELVTDIDIGIPESRAQEICVPVTNEIQNDVEEIRPSTTPPPTPAIEPPLSEVPIAAPTAPIAVAVIAGAAAATVAVTAAKSKTSPIKKTPTPTPSSKTTTKTPTPAKSSTTPAKTPITAKTSTSATKRPTPSTTSRAAPTKPTAPKAPVSAAAKTAKSSPKPPSPTKTAPKLPATVKDAPATVKAAPARVTSAPRPAPKLAAPKPPTTTKSTTSATKLSTATAAPRAPITKPAPRSAATKATPTTTVKTAVPSMTKSTLPTTTKTGVSVAAKPKAPEKKSLPNGDVKSAAKPASKTTTPTARNAPRPAPRATAPIPAKSATAKPPARVPLDKQSKDLANKRITAKAAPPRTAPAKSSMASKTAVKSVPKKSDAIKKEVISNGLNGSAEPEVSKPPPSPPVDNALLPDVIA